MLWWPFYVLCGSFILAFAGALSLDEYSTVAYDPDEYSTVAYDPDEYSTVAYDHDDSTFIRNLSPFMFTENFLSRFPEEADSYRLKIFVYLLFNLLIKGYGTHDPVTIWENYNRDNYKRALIDAVFYEYLTDYKDKGDKDPSFDPLENSRSNFSNLVSNEEIAVHRIGQYLDLLSENESGPELIKGAYDILSEQNGDPTLSEDQPAECKGQHYILTSGVPGVNYPNFCSIPETSFKCAQKQIPGVYPDYETGCQVFHVCWPTRQDSFLCPVGTIFNESLWACDVWHDTGCYSSPLLSKQRDVASILKEIPIYDGSCQSILTAPLQENIKFLPSKCEVKDVIDGKVRPQEPDVRELKARFDLAYNLIVELLHSVALARRELDDRISGRRRRTSRIHPLSMYLEESTPDLDAETWEEDTKFTRKRGETPLKQSRIAELESVGEKPESGKKLGHSVRSSTLLRPSKSLEHFEGRRPKDVPEIVTRSLKLGGAILNEGVIPLAKQIMMDSYRKIESKMH